MRSRVNIEDLLLNLAQEMQTGEIRAFLEARSTLEKLDLVDVSAEVTKEQLLSLYVGRHFVMDVLANIAGAATFSFPDRDSNWGRLLTLLIQHTGRYFESLSQLDHKRGAESLGEAVHIFYRLLSDILEEAQVSDLHTLG